jgi:hypothetical protein
MASSPAILTTEAFAAPKSNNKDCKDTQFRTFESGNTMTIGTSQHEYSVKIDYLREIGTDEVVWFKNVAARDPPGKVLLPGGETITITLTNEGFSVMDGPASITLYNHKVSDCQILLGPVKDEDKVNLQIVSSEQTDGRSPIVVKLTVQVPDASEIDKHFTKLGVRFKFNYEQYGHYLISHKVQVR